MQSKVLECFATPLEYTLSVGKSPPGESTSCTRSERLLFRVPFQCRLAQQFVLASKLPQALQFRNQWAVSCNASPQPSKGRTGLTYITKTNNGDLGSECLAPVLNRFRKQSIMHSVSISSTVNFAYNDTQRGIKKVSLCAKCRYTRSLIMYYSWKGLCSGHENAVVIRELSLYPQSLLAKLTVHRIMISMKSSQPEVSIAVPMLLVLSVDSTPSIYIVQAVFPLPGKHLAHEKLFEEWKCRCNFKHHCFPVPILQCVCVCERRKSAPRVFV